MLCLFYKYFWGFWVNFFFFYFSICQEELRIVHFERFGVGFFHIQNIFFPVGRNVKMFFLREIKKNIIEKSFFLNLSTQLKKLREKKKMCDAFRLSANKKENMISGCKLAVISWKLLLTCTCLFVMSIKCLLWT